MTPEQVRQALAVQRAQGGKTAEILIAMGHLTHEQLAKALSRQHAMPSVELSQYQLDSNLMPLIPRDFALRNEVIPIDRLGKLLTVGVAFPLKEEIVREIEEFTKLRVRFLLCSAADIRAAIAREYGPPEAGDVPPAPDSPDSMASVLRLNALPALIQRMESLPALPETVTEVRKALDDDEVSVKEVAAVIGRDPAVAAKLLAVANSAALALSHRVESIDTAVSLLGLNDTYSLVASVAAMDLVPGSSALEARAFWRQSQQSAGVAVAVARACGIRRTTAIYSVALLHDIGRLVLATLRPEQYAHIDQGLPHVGIVAAEKELFGIAHTEAGFVLADAWALPPEFIETIRYHHDLGLAHYAPDAVAILQVANALCEAIRNGTEDTLPVACAEALDLLQLEGPLLEGLCGVARGIATA